MLRKKNGEIEWLEFSLLQGKPVVHGIFLRRGGVSPAPFDSLNVCLGSEDKKENILENRRRINRVLNLEKSLYLDCEHKDALLLLEGKNREDRGDGIITQEKGIGIGFSIADCQAAIFYDPVHHVLANVHAGWRGQVLHIYTKTIAFLQNQFASRPSDLLVCISPSLAPHNAEFIHYQQELPPSFWPHQVKPNHFHLWDISKEELLRAGIQPHHLEIASLSTYDHPHDFFSYRRDKARLGMAALAALT